MSRKFDYSQGLFSERKLINEMAPFLILSFMIDGEPRKANELHQEIKELFSELDESLINFPASYLYPLMKGLLESGYVTRSSVQPEYKITSLGKAKVRVETNSLSYIAKTINSYLKKVAL